MIVRMCRLRILGRTERLEAALGVLQDLEMVHVARVRETPGLQEIEASPERAQERERLQGLVEDLEAVARLLPGGAHDGPRPEVVNLAAWPERARALRAELEGLADRTRDLEQERVTLERFRDVVRGFEPLLERAQADPTTRARYLVLKADPQPIVAELRRVMGEGVDVLVRSLDGGQWALAILVPLDAADRVDAVLHAAALDELPAPEGYGGASLMSALPRMVARLEALAAELAAVLARREALASAHGAEVAAALAAAHDRLSSLDASGLASATGRAFVLEGWVPVGEEYAVATRVEERLGPEIAVERVEVEEWGEPAPVKLRNPRMFQPFEAILSLVPLPRYGTIDPTPFIAVSFPMLFGIVLGDVGYGLILALIALILRLRSEPGSVGRSVSAVGAACAVFTTIFGVLYGEYFGDLAHRLWGWEAVLLNREEAIVPALVLALGVGGVHILLGLVMGVFSAGRAHLRQAIGRGLEALMLVLIGLSILAVAEVLPRAVFTPLIVAAVLAFPLMVVAEGILAPIEVMSTFAHILSYARIMAVGTASVLMAVVANRVAGAMGSVLVGALFGLLFHLVNFALGVFGPTIHVLRLHYVEFFGEFYSPGGLPYRPLRRWHPRPEGP